MSAILDEIKQLDFAERIQLVEDLWDSVAMQATELPLTEAQRVELDRRLAMHQANPGRGVTLSCIAEKLGIAL
ncbi:MAG: addiction module protein [Proteobacteria bacterium]|nr:addiction module protein [Pseudomonadota bacterium]